MPVWQLGAPVQGAHFIQSSSFKTGMGIDQVFDLVRFLILAVHLDPITQSSNEFFG
jgi:hypothetical protein